MRVKDFGAEALVGKLLELSERGLKIVVTGTLESLSREEAKRAVMEKRRRLGFGSVKKYRLRGGRLKSRQQI